MPQRRFFEPTGPDPGRLSSSEPGPPGSKRRAWPPSAVTRSTRLRGGRSSLAARSASPRVSRGGRRSWTSSIGGSPNASGTESRSATMPGREVSTRWTRSPTSSSSRQGRFPYTSFLKGGEDLVVLVLGHSDGARFRWRLTSSSTMTTALIRASDGRRIPGRHWCESRDRDTGTRPSPPMWAARPIGPTSRLFAEHDATDDDQSAARPRSAATAIVSSGTFHDEFGKRTI